MHSTGKKFKKQFQFHSESDISFSVSPSGKWWLQFKFFSLLLRLFCFYSFLTRKIVILKICFNFINLSFLQFACSNTLVLKCVQLKTKVKNTNLGLAGEGSLNKRARGIYCCNKIKVNAHKSVPIPLTLHGTVIPEGFWLAPYAHCPNCHQWLVTMELSLIVHTGLIHFGGIICI